MLLMGILEETIYQDPSPCSAFRLLSVIPGAPKSIAVEGLNDNGTFDAHQNRI